MADLPINEQSGASTEHIAERRLMTRQPTDRAVYFAGKGSLLQNGQVTEISRGGMRIATASPLPAGAEIEIEVLPKHHAIGTPLVMRGRVVHLAPLPDHQTAMGVCVWGGRDKPHIMESLAKAYSLEVSPSAEGAYQPRATTPRQSSRTFLARKPGSRHRRYSIPAAGAIFVLIAAVLYAWRASGVSRETDVGSLTAALASGSTGSPYEPRRSPLVSYVPPGIDRLARKDHEPPTSKAVPPKAKTDSAGAPSSGSSGGATAMVGRAHGSPSTNATHEDYSASAEPMDEFASVGDGQGGPENDLWADSSGAPFGAAASVIPASKDQSSSNGSAPDTASVPVASILAPPFAADLARGPGNKNSDSESVRLMIDKSDHALVLYRGGRPLRVFPVGLGRDDSTPEGLFHIINKLTNPDWYTGGKVIPGGSPLNRIGKRWMGLANDQGRTSYGIHPAKNPDTVGRDASLGCVQMKSEDAETLFRFCPVGTQVIIQP